MTLLPDDTQPHPLALDATQPLHLRRRLPTWALIALVLSSVALLMVSFSALIAPRSPAPLSASPTPTASAAAQATLRAVTLIVDGERRSIRTPHSAPRSILAAAGIALDGTEQVWLDGSPADASALDAWPLPPLEIEIRRDITFTVQDDGQSPRTLTSRAATLGEALYAAGYTLYEADLITPPLASPLSPNMQVTITRALPLTIQADGQQLNARVQAGVVADALAVVGLTLAGLDYTIPDLSAPLEAAMHIQVVRIREDILTEDVPLDFTTSYQADPNLALDARQEMQVGVPGLLRRSARVRYADGQEMSREPLGEEVLQAPQDRIIAYGTQVILYDLATPEGTLQYWRKLRVYATSYHPAALGGDNITAIGATLQKGIVGADPKLIPYRTSVYVAGYGTGIIADTGGPRSSPYWIDLGYSDEDFVGWHRYVDIYLLAPAPATIPYLLPDWRPMRGLPDSGG